MSVHAINEAERTRDSQQLRERPMSPNVRRGEIVFGGVFLLVASALALLAGSFSLLSAAVYVLGIAVAANVRFDVGAGFTVPTQAVFVPMLFALPALTVPLF